MAFMIPFEQLLIFYLENSKRQTMPGFPAPN